jgi:hypothetical protein
MRAFRDGLQDKRLQGAVGASAVLVEQYQNKKGLEVPNGSELRNEACP